MRVVEGLQVLELGLDGHHRALPRIACSRHDKHASEAKAWRLSCLGRTLELQRQNDRDRYSNMRLLTRLGEPSLPRQD